ncbi:MAG: macro domain-containing protein [Arhodomonas sp.]|nr:macro domain-containing protein [Arhodomonas sp.]
MSVTRAQTTIECVVGDITRQDDADAVVNAANAQLMPGGGVAGAIHRVAGPGLAEECAPLAPIRPGEAVLTGGHGLPNPHVIHCLGPVYGHDEPADRFLADCYRNALRLADDHQLGTVAFPALSTGAFGYPMAAAADVAMSTLCELAAGLHHVRCIRMVLTDERVREIHERALAEACGS